MWWDHLPASVVFCDVETTGLGNDDRVVSFGGIGMISRGLARRRPDLEYVYLVFDPGKRNRRGAQQIHGFSDSALRLQDPFPVHAADVRRFLTGYELLVAHNAAFDIRFINREMRLAGLPALCCLPPRMAWHTVMRLTRAAHRAMISKWEPDGLAVGMSRPNRGLGFVPGCRVRKDPCFTTSPRFSWGFGRNSKAARALHRAALEANCRAGPRFRPPPG